MAFFRNYLSDAMRHNWHLRISAVALLSAALSTVTCAQGPATPNHPQTPAKISKKAESNPSWNELTPAQQHALAPLAGEWGKMESARKEKWLVISKKFAHMTPAEQDRMQERMRDWIKLTPAQRRAVRESYARAKKLDAQKKSAQWLEYQQLPEEQKKKLAQSRPPKRASSLPVPHEKNASRVQLLPSDSLEHHLNAPKQAAPLPATERN